MMFGSEDLSAQEPSLSEINARLPRRVRLYSDEAPKLLFVAVAVLAAAAIWFGCYHYYATRVQQREALRYQGRELTAVVTQLLSAKGGTYVRYTFRVGSVWYQGETKLPRDGRADPSVNQPILVRYLPSDPSVNHPSAWEWSLGWDTVPVLWFVLLAFGAFAAALITAGTLLRERTLAREGLVAEGQVTACSPNRSKFSVEYKFHAEGNVIMEGSNEYSDNEYEVGSSVRVIYLRHHPKTNALYPLSSFYVAK
jgi:hypothetical protein